MPTKFGNSIEYPVEAFGRVILDVARQIPYSHKSQERLVQLLDQFHRLIEFNLANEQEVRYSSGGRFCWHEYWRVWL